MTEDQIIESIRKNLVDFGYEGLRTETVKASYDKAMAREKPVNIIDMMTAKQLDQNGLLPTIAEES